LVATWQERPPLTELDASLQRSLAEVYGFVVGYTESMHAVCRSIRIATHEASLALDLRTMIFGETGTGKELVARAIHRLGKRSEAPFVSVNCAGVHADLIDSEIFGHVRGAFTGALSDRAGAIATAGIGVLFLDEIGDMPIELQPKLLRVLEQRRFAPIGSDQSFALRAAVVSATNQELDKAVKKGSFRADLYFRIAQLQVYLPPLRDRMADLTLLLESFLQPHGLHAASLGTEAMNYFATYSWPGNVRELKSMAERFVLFRISGSTENSLEWLRQILPQGTGIRPASLAERRTDFDRRVLEEVMARCGGDTACVAAELRITRRSVYNLLRRYGMHPRS
jgi:transcriptional regulator with GAF, ATPase, and Fis domain